MDFKSLRFRALLTDTLPYEVPVIFSNSILHASLSSPPKDPIARDKIGRIRERASAFSKPYSYEISKGAERSTTLSIVHPAWQIQMAEFYEHHAASLLTYCSDERFSLRRPAAVASPFTEAASDDAEARLKLGVAQMAADAGEPDVSHLTTYFAYRRYNLLGRFADSREHQRLEMRFSYRRQLDISKCFYNIYTHSVTWAVKGKDFSKKHSNNYTFEGSLDSLFQKINYNETNGIVVGPEFSRIFSEIILQRIDMDLTNMLANGDPGFEVTKDYDVRRYVDDYYIFANSIEVVDRVERALSAALEAYKLYLNTSKRETVSRPFVSDISLARYEISGLLREMRAALRSDVSQLSPPAQRALLRSIRSLLSDVRLAVKSYGVQFENVSGWLLGRYRSLARSLLTKIAESENCREFFSDVVISVVEASIYVCAVDTRVRTTYSLCQLLDLISEFKDHIPRDHADQLDHVVTEGLAGMLRTIWASKSKRSRDSVELYNLLIAGSRFQPSEFMDQKIVFDIILELSTIKLTYFRYISLKYCLLSGPVYYKKILDNLNQEVEFYLLAAPDWKVSSEDYLLFCDFMSSPDIEVARKQAVFKKLVGGAISNAGISEIASHIGFVDWSGLSIKHLLKRKTLRPVYAWS